MSAVDSQPRVLLLGWKQQAVEALVSLGADVTVLVTPDKYQLACESDLEVSKLLVGDTSNVSDVLCEIEKRQLVFSHVCSAKEYSLVAAATVSRLFGCGGLALDVALRLRDKKLQKTAIADAGIRVASCGQVETITELLDRRELQPSVIKPLAGAGSRNTVVVRDLEDVKQLTARWTGLAAVGPWAVEEFVQGVEYQVDGCVRAGKIIGFSVSRYLNNVIDISKGGLVGAVTLSPERHHDMYRQVGELSTSSLAALGHRDGVFHLELFDTAQGLVFSECAGRVGGGLSHRLAKEMTGIDLHSEWANAVLGRSAGLPTVPSEDHSSVGDLGLSTPPGVIVEVPKTDDLLRLQGVVEGEIRADVGDTVGDSSDASHINAGQVLVRGENETQVEERLRSIDQWFRSKTIVV